MLLTGRKSEHSSLITPSASLLHKQLRSAHLLDFLPIRLQRWLDLIHNQLLHQLRASADKARAVRQSVELRQDGRKELALRDTFEQIVLLAFLLDHGARLLGKDADFFVRGLS